MATTNVIVQQEIDLCAIVKECFTRRNNNTLEDIEDYLKEQKIKFTTAELEKILNKFLHEGFLTVDFMWRKKSLLAKIFGGRTYFTVRFWIRRDNAS